MEIEILNEDGNENLSWSDLPANPLIQIFSYLTVKDLISCSSLNHHWNFLSKENSLWKYFVKRDWALSQLPEGETLFRNVYVKYMKEYGRYISCYAKVRTAWDLIISLLEKNQFTHILGSLEKGVSEEELDSYENENNVKIPEDLRLSYRFYNGQNLNNRRTAGIFGGYQFYDYRTNFAYLGLHPPKSNFIPVAFSPSSSTLHYVNVLTSEVVVFGADGLIYFLIAPNWQQYLHEFASSLESGNYEFDSVSRRIVTYPSKVGISEYTTRDVRVQVSPLFVPEQSNLNKYFFAYRIRMSMAKDAPPEHSCILTTRHWIIHDQNGNQEEVKGPGVIGEYPEMYPGAFFEYASCCPLSTPTGSMRGTFQMKYQSGEIKDIIVPEYQFKSTTRYLLQLKKK